MTRPTVAPRQLAPSGVWLRPAPTVAPGQPTRGAADGSFWQSSSFSQDGQT